MGVQRPPTAELGSSLAMPTPLLPSGMATKSLDPLLTLKPNTNPSSNNGPSHYKNKTPQAVLDCGSKQLDPFTVDSRGSLEEYHKTAVAHRDELLAGEVGNRQLLIVQ